MNKDLKIAISILDKLSSEEIKQINDMMKFKEAQAKQEGRKEALKEIFDEAIKEGYYHLAELKELKKEYEELKDGKDETIR